MAIYELVGEEISIKVKSLGAELVSLKDLKTEQEYMWNADPKFWPRTSPVLFPFVGKLKNQQYTWKGQVYHPTAHGFARDTEFELIEQTADKLAFRIVDTDATREVYPFAFAFEIEYSIQGREVKVAFKVSNRGEEQMLFSLGAHPGFVCPLSPEKKRSEYYVHFEGVDVIKSRDFNVETGLVLNTYTDYELEEGALRITDDLFDGDALVLEDGQVEAVSLLDENRKPYITIKMQAPVYGIWSKVGAVAPYVCLEPWFGRCDADDFSGELQDREYQNELEPGKSFETFYTIGI